jgi:hypothetical protein
MLEMEAEREVQEGSKAPAAPRWAWLGALLCLGGGKAAVRA